MIVPMRLITGSCAALLGMAVASGAPARAADKEMTDRVNRLIRPLLESGSINALSLGFVDGDQTFVLNFGRITPERPETPDADTVYEIGSITKVFTTTILADMVERKEIDLNDPVAKYLPGSVKMPEYDGTPITLLDLATQSSGLPPMPTNFTPGDPTNPYKDYTADLMYAFLSGYKLSRKPGEKYEYSNLGVGLLGHALARRAGTDYESLVKQRILAPLQMSESGITLTPSMRAHLAPGHDADGDPAANWDLDVLAGAGGIRSTVKDMLRFLEANLGKGAGSLQSAMALAQKSRRPLSFPGSIGLAWHILPDGKTTWHNGGTGGYRTMLAFNRDKRQGIVALCSTANEQITALGFALLRVLAGESPEPLKLPVVIKLGADVLDRYAGQYEIAPGIVLTVMRRGDHLKAQLTGQDAFGIYPSAEREFFYRVVNAQITFEVDASGKAAGLVLHQDGRNTRARKITETR